MSTLHLFSRCSGLPVLSFEANTRIKLPATTLSMASAIDSPRIVTAKAVSGSTSNTEESNTEVEEEISEVYSNNITKAMGAVLTYRHDLGMNYNFILPDLIVGSCLQNPEDVDKLRRIGVKTIFCLQQNSDLEYFGVDIAAIRDYVSSLGDIQHLRAEIRDFDGFDLRMRLPAVVSKLHNAINNNGGVTYIHCTAGLGRAPATALAYMFWIQGYELNEASSLLLSKRSCFLNLDAIKSATIDIRIPLTYDKAQGFWVLQRELPEGRYEYKYIVDGEWTSNSYELLTPANKDGHVNNYIQVSNEDPNSITAELWERMNGSESKDSIDLTKDERVKIRQLLETYSEDKCLISWITTQY